MAFEEISSNAPRLSYFLADILFQGSVITCASIFFHVFCFPRAKSRTTEGEKGLDNLPTIRNCLTRKKKSKRFLKGSTKSRLKITPLQQKEKKTVGSPCAESALPAEPRVAPKRGSGG